MTPNNWNSQLPTLLVPSFLPPEPLSCLPPQMIVCSPQVFPTLECFFFFLFITSRHLLFVMQNWCISSLSPFSHWRNHCGAVTLQVRQSHETADNNVTTRLFSFLFVYLFVLALVFLCMRFVPFINTGSVFCAGHCGPGALQDNHYSLLQRSHGLYPHVWHH